MAQFFIDRPVFAWVIAIFIMFAGGLSIMNLAISQYPEIAPTTISVSATYPGASADTVENSVTKVIEQNLTGLDNLDYMNSNSGSDGSASITLTFKQGADGDIALMQTQNKINQIQSQLPDAVVDQGLRVSKSTGSILLVAGLISTDAGMSGEDLADLVTSTLEDPIRRVEGVGDLRVFGSQYAMRVWLDPDKMAKFALTVSDVTTAVQAQNTQVSAGQLGALPAVSGTQLNVTITAQSQLTSAEQFREIILKTQTDGSMVRLGDVARVELGVESYTNYAFYNGRPSAGFGVSLTTGANALQTSTAVREALEKLKAALPSSVQIVTTYDTTPFVQRSISKVVETLVEAVVLVFLVMLLFLQNIRATLIPCIAVPVVLLGTFGVLAAFGYTINTLTMFAMVLAIGLLVDDAIVVVENVERIMKEEGLGPREATQKSMREITGALIGIALVLSAVFVPMAFFDGSVGVIYRQFSITIVSAMLLSVLVALVLTPALCASFLKPMHGEGRGFFGWFNRGFAKTTLGFQSSVRGMIGRPIRMFLLFLVFVFGVVHMFDKLPSSFIPAEDQGVLMAQVQLPSGATAARTEAAVRQIQEYFETKEKDNVASMFISVGFSFSGSGQNAAMGFIRLKDFSERATKERGAAAIAGRAMAALSGIRDARVFILQPPMLPGLGMSGGFDLYLQDMAEGGRDGLSAARDRLLEASRSDPALSATRENAPPEETRLHVEIDREKAGALGVEVSEINKVLSTAWAGAFVNDFIDRGKVKSVYVQGDAPFRMTVSDLDRWFARNSSKQMVPFSAFVSTSWTYGPPRLTRFNGVSAINIQGSAGAGASSGDAMNAVEKIVADMGGGYSVAWSGLSYQERLSGSQQTMLYAVSGLVVFLCLAALYESWTIPFAVLLSVPIGVLGALLAAKYTGQSNDVYFKVGLLTTIGLASKNAILIVEYARDLRRRGETLIDATLHAVRIRLRPIVMTSLAFILGVTPLAVATGAGSAAQNSIGIGVMGGMLASTLVGIFFVPLLFYIVTRLFERGGGELKSAPELPS